MSRAPEYRMKAIEEYGEECKACGDTEDVVVHHKDGDGNNDHISNLIPLCSSCHQKVHGGNDELSELVEELGKRPRKAVKTSIQVTTELADLLHNKKGRGQSYEDVIWDLIDQAGTGDD